MKYWALKTWEDTDGSSKYSPDKEKWANFLDNQEIAIGWRNLGISLSENTLEKDILAELKKYPDGFYQNKKTDKAARIIFNFIHLKNEDCILLCRGYSWSTQKVHLYGKATNVEAFYDTNNPKEWRFKHKAKVEAFGKDGKYIPKNELVEMLSIGNILGKKPQMGSLIPTLVQISEEGYMNVLTWAQKD